MQPHPLIELRAREREWRRKRRALLSIALAGALGLMSLPFLAQPSHRGNGEELLIQLQDAPIDELLAAAAWISCKAQMDRDPRAALLLDRLARHVLAAKPADVRSWIPLILPGLDALGLATQRDQLASLLSPARHSEPPMDLAKALANLRRRHHEALSAKAVPAIQNELTQSIHQLVRADQQPTDDPRTKRRRYVNRGPFIVFP